MIKLFYLLWGVILDHSIEARAILLLVPFEYTCTTQSEPWKKKKKRKRKKNGGRSSTWGKSKGKNILGVGGVEGICCFIQPMAAKVHKENIFCVLGTKRKKLFLGMCRDSTTQEQKAKLPDKTDVQSVR